MSSISKNLSNKLDVNVNHKKILLTGDAEMKEQFYVFLGFNDLLNNGIQEVMH